MFKLLPVYMINYRYIYRAIGVYGELSIYNYANYNYYFHYLWRHMFIRTNFDMYKKLTKYS